MMMELGYACVHAVVMQKVMNDTNTLGYKADLHIACRAHAVPLIHTFHAAPLPCSDSAVSFVKVRVVAGNIRTASPTV
jgi:hypothetical protein